MNDSISILKRLRRRMQMKSIRLLQVAAKQAKRKGHISKGSGGGAWLIMRAHTWEFACMLLDEEIGALECQIKNLNK